MSRRALFAWFSAAGVLALAVRLTSWAEVFTPTGVRLVADGDPYYHVRRAWLILQEGAIPWRDGWLNYPLGADIPWPPLFDLLVAGVAWAAGGGSPSRERLLAAAAVVPVALGVAGVLVAGAMAGEVLGRWIAVATALLLAAAPGSYTFGMLGRADQHVLEILIFAIVLLAFLRAVRADPWRGRGLLASGALGAALALGFWNWPGMPIIVAFLVAAAVAWRVLADDATATRPARALPAACTLAAALLAATILALKGPSALLMIEVGGLSGFAPLVCLGAAVVAVVLLAPVRARSLHGRGVRVGGALVVLAVAVLALLPSFRATALRGMGAIRGGDPFFASILEFRPVLFSGSVPLRDEAQGLFWSHGLVPVLMVAGAPEWRRRWREEPDLRLSLFLLAALAVVFVAAGFRVQRFMLYATVPISIGGALGIAWIARRLAHVRPALRAAAVALAGVVAAGPGLALGLPGAFESPRTTELLDLLARFPRRSGPPGAVMCWWNYGHHVLWQAQHPVVGTPFGTEGGAGAFEDVAAFYLERDDRSAMQLLDRRGVQWVLLDDASLAASSLAEAYPGRSPLVATHDVVEGTRYADAGLGHFFASRLYALAPGTSGFRLVDESRDFEREGVRFKLFERVPGALLVVSTDPGAEVLARATLRTPTGGEVVWWKSSRADAAGRAAVRLPYASGLNGRVLASRWTISGARGETTLGVDEWQVRWGSPIEATIPGVAAQRAAARPAR